MTSPRTWAIAATAAVGAGAALVSAAAFLVPPARHRRRPTRRAPDHPAPDPRPAGRIVAARGIDPAGPVRVAPAALPDDVLAAIPRQVTAVSRFGPHGGFVDAGGLVVWAALTRPAESVRPGGTLTVLSPSHERDALLVRPAVRRAPRAEFAGR